ncbi:MAG: MBL fold metallo-hydrolase [Ornithinimicrobium sp.]
MQLTHFGHSCVVVDVAGERLLIDPGGFSDVEGVRDVSAVLVTHTHPDHLDPAALPALRRDNPHAALWLESEAADHLISNEPQLEAHVSRMQIGHELHFGPVTVTPVGRQHALIHDYVPRPDNIGLVITADGEPSIFHPGDALDADHPVLDGIDVLCVPINAPWASVADTVAFVRRLKPRRVVPIHDGLLNDAGRKMYVGHVERFGADDGVEVLELKGQGVVDVPTAH